MLYDLDTKIEGEKQRFRDFIICNKDKKIYIYGAGRNAKPLIKFLKSEGVIIHGLCVSNLSDNKASEQDIPIIHISEIKDNPNNVAIIIGTKPMLNYEIIKTLNEYGFLSYLESTEYIRYLGDYGYEFYNNPMMEITTQIGCSVNCKFCPQELFINKYMNDCGADLKMSYDTFVKCIDKLPKNVLIEFAGFAEPFLNSECLEMIKYAIKKGHKINLFTTLVGVNERILQELLSIQFEEFVLHVPDQEGYSNIPINEDYLLMIDAISKAKKPNGDEYIDYACSQGTTPAIVRERLGKQIRIYASLNDRAGNLNDDSLYKKCIAKGKIKCELSRALNHNVLLPDGRVVLCSQDFGLKHVLGNLLVSDYDLIVNGNVSKKIEKNMELANDDILCRKCCMAVECC